MRKPDRDTAMVAVLSICIWACHYSIFLQFFPNRYGRLGHDYSIFLPALIDGLFWFKVNGLSAVPWFTPSFSGGGLGYLHIERAFYTLPQFLAFAFEPLTVLRISFGIFSLAGQAGCYGLLRKAFAMGRPAAVFGASLFLFNGFFSHRMIVGHFGASPFMLLPALALVLLHPLPGDPASRRRWFWTDVVAGGMMIAYMVQTWFALLILPAILAVVSLGIFHGLLFGRPAAFWRRLVAAGGAGAMFCASKLVATAYLLDHMDRSQYLLPGAVSFPEALGLMVRSLFISPGFDPDRMQHLTNVQWFLDRHEWEFGLTPVPLLLLVSWAAVAVCRRRGGPHSGTRRWRRWGQWALLGGIVLLPPLLNTYNPGWNRFLKMLPLIKSSSTLIRWFLVPMPLIVVASALAVDRLPLRRHLRTGLLVACLGTVAWFNVMVDRGFYHRQFYDPGPMTDAFRQVVTGETTPGIRSITAHVGGDGRFGIDPAGPNDAFVRGASPMLCYDAFFGYRQEFFPLKTLHPGPVTDIRQGSFNVKNPACYVWPEANGCVPGDHFAASQGAEAMAFVRYRPYPFAMPAVQKMANVVNVISLAAALFWLALAWGGTAIRSLWCRCSQ